MALAAGEVHAWLFRLDLPAAALADLAVLLDDTERERAARFVFAADRDRFVAGRARLRSLLGGYLGVAAGKVTFAYGAEGKPSLAADAALPTVHFNLSHCGDRAVLGVARDGEVGVDIEAHRDLAEAEAIARTHFAPPELRRYLALPAAEQKRAFFSCWTRKEAYVKALGGGLSVALGGFEVAFAAGDPARLVAVGGSAQAAAGWSLWDLDVGAETSAALIVRTTGAKLRRLELG